MSTVNISYKPEKSEKYVWNWIDENLEKMVAKKVPTEDIKLLLDRTREVVEFKGKTIKGLMTFKNGEINISIDIPLLYRMFGQTIRTSILDILKSM
jgi:hypothetical protein